MRSARRLNHTSYAAQVRLMQMSSCELFVLIEGKEDRYFYDRICNSFFGPLSKEYQITTADELPCTERGKKALLEFFSYLSSHSALITEFKGKRTAVIFYLDKDIDDLTGTCIVSKHVVYTQYYELENYIFKYSDLTEGAAAAYSLTKSSLGKGLKSSEEWRRKAAECWKEWTKLCIFNQVYNLNCPYAYGLPSKVNNGPYAPLNSHAHQSCLEELERKSGLTRRGFKRVFNRISRNVDKLYRDGNFDVIFKGKWYTVFFASDVKRIANITAIKQIGTRRFNQLSSDDAQLWRSLD